MKRAVGFILIELMIVVAVIAILAAIAIPAYGEHVRKARRAEAMRSVGDLQLQLERWRAENPSYADCSGCGSGTYPSAGSSDFYEIEISNAAPTTYTVTATGKGAQRDDRCGVLTLTAAAPKPSWATASCN